MTDHDAYDRACAEERERRMREQCEAAGGLFAEPTPEPSPEPTPVRHFDGATYDPEHDQERLSTQLERVKAVGMTGYFTLAELKERCGGSEAGISARLRDLRKTRFGGYVVDPQRRDDPKDGIWEYRVYPPGTQLQVRPHGQEAA
jgi:hypothetical protein